MKSHISVIISILLLVSCTNNSPSDGPSNEDVSSEIKSHYNKVNTLSGSGWQFIINSIENLGCRKHKKENNGYLCDVEIDITAPVAGRSTNIEVILFIKSKEGHWEGIF